MNSVTNARRLVVCVMEDVKATAHNPLEAALVARVVNALRDRLPVASDDEFKAEAVFIVCPHHAQIRAMRRSMHRCAWDAPAPGRHRRQDPGQEPDAVVISYGVSDVEYALSEQEFIYSLNRLNVAITRARAKSIVFLSRRSSSRPSALDHDRRRRRRLHAGPRPLVRVARPRPGEAHRRPALGSWCCGRAEKGIARARENGREPSGSMECE